jgi:hypothetical protein
MTIRKYSSRSQQTTLSTGITSTDATATVVSGANLLSSVNFSIAGTFTVVIDPDTALEEIVDVTGRSGNVLDISRGIENGGTGVAHSAGAVVRHMVTGRDLQEANDHIKNETTAHGLTIANVVTLAGSQTLTSKTLTSPTITGTGAIAGTFTGNLTGNVTGDVSGTAGSATGNAATATALQTARDFQLTGDVEASAVSFDGTGNVSLTTVIGTGVIVNADINASAAIDKTKISGTAITAADSGTVTSAMIEDGTIVNADINSSAQIAYSKTNLTNSIVNADINASAGIELSKLATDPLARANHTGSQTASTISDFDTQVRTNRLDQMAAPTGSVSLNSQKITNLATPTDNTDASTKDYVDTSINNLIDGAPSTLDTLNEIAAALADTANFSDTVVLKSGSTMSGALAMGTNKITGLGEPTLAQDAATKNYIDTASIAPSNLTGPITSVGPATSIASQTGTGTKFVVDTSPTLVTPDIGVATATSINGTTIPASKTLVATDSTTYVVPSQTGNSGKYLTTDGTTSSWGAISGSLAQPSEPESPSDGLIWVDTDGSVVGQALTRWSKAPTGGTTSLSGTDDGSTTLSYTVGYEQVYRNGVLLSRGNDYTATDGTSITLTDATITGDIIEVFASAVLAIADVYTQAQSDSKYATLTTAQTLTNKTLTAPKVNLAFNAQTGTTYTLVAADSGKLVTSSNAASVIVTIPPSVFAAGEQINIQSIGAGITSLAQGAGVTITSTGATSSAPALRAQFSAATIICTASNVFTVIGDIS